MPVYLSNSEGSKTCARCGSVLPTDGEEQFFCGQCGAPLGRGQAGGPVEPPVFQEAAVSEEAAVLEEASLPDWLEGPDPVAEAPRPASPQPAPRLVIQPKTPRRPETRPLAGDITAPGRGAVALFVVIALLCMGLGFFVLLVLGLVAGG